MKKFSLLEALVLPAISSMATLAVGAGPLLIGGYRSPELVLGTTIATPFIIATGNAIIQKSNYDRNLLSKDNLMALGVSYLGGAIGGGPAGYIWYEFYKFMSSVNFGGF